MEAENEEKGVSPHVRRLRPEDADSIVAIGKESPQAANWSRDSYLNFVKEDGAVALIVEVGDEIGGFLIGRQIAGDAEILNLAVALRHRRKGEGAKILKAALAEFRLRGVKNVYLEVRESNTDAILFYERHGFAIAGYRKGYYHQPDEPAVTMVRKLTVSMG
jgi:ribosomal-protein-alanine N-acetyltransferase